ncbi:hypothetical protein TNCV_3275021 [Trichonephila clavipes]|nr:hypothetical protein TNCV_3275021 [Trichonephila clavipes]
MVLVNNSALNATLLDAEDRPFSEQETKYSRLVVREADFKLIVIGSIPGSMLLSNFTIDQSQQGLSAHFRTFPPKPRPQSLTFQDRRLESGRTKYSETHRNDLRNRRLTHTFPVATPPCHIIPTNQDSLIETNPSISGYSDNLDMG